MKNKNNVAYIDGANLHKGMESLGWDLDYKRFRVWLSDKFGIKKAYIFIGLISRHNEIYNNLQEAGFILIFKEVICCKDGTIKGNCDSDLVLKTVCDFYEKETEGFVVVSSDGDYACLVDFLKNKGVFCALVSPSNKCSYLLRKQNTRLMYMDILKSKLEKVPQNEKAPGKDRTLQGSLS